MFGRFEDIKAWQKSRSLNKNIGLITSSSKFNKELYLKDQLKRALISTALNIAEGFGKRSNKDFSHFLFIANGSITEVQSAFYLALDANTISKNEFQWLYDQANEVSKLISGFLSYLSGR